MGLLHALSCLALTLAPHVIYYFSTELAEHDARKSCMYGAISSCICTVIKAVLLATFLPGTSATSAYGLYLRDTVFILVSLVDVVCLWAALTKWTHRNISNAHKLQAVGLGWGFADSLLRRAPLLLAAVWRNEQTWEFVQYGVQSNIQLIRAISFAAVGTLIWAKKGRINVPMPVLRLALLAHVLLPAAISILEHHHVLNGFRALAVELAITVPFALTSWKLYQRASTRQDS